MQFIIPPSLLYVLAELSPPTLSLDESSLVSVSNKRWRFTLEWEPQTERTVTGYVIAVDPPLSGGQCSTCVINRNATSFPFELGLNVQHDFMIRRINCNGTVADTPGGDFRVMFLGTYAEVEISCRTCWPCYMCLAGTL